MLTSHAIWQSLSQWSDKARNALKAAGQFGMLDMLGGQASWDCFLASDDKGCCRRLGRRQRLHIHGRLHP